MINGRRSASRRAHWSQIGQARFQLDSVSHHQPGFARRVERDLDILAERTAQQLHYPVRNLLTSTCCGWGCGGRGEQPPRQVGAAQRRIERLLGQLPGGAIHALDHCIEVADDDAQQIVEVVPCRQSGCRSPPSSAPVAACSVSWVRRCVWPLPGRRAIRFFQLRVHFLQLRRAQRARAIGMIFHTRKR
jgi:hypothetical protein